MVLTRKESIANPLAATPSAQALEERLSHASMQGTAPAVFDGASAFAEGPQSYCSVVAKT
ncbi:MAG: hypothetical protein ACQEUY_07155 [Pseudomonadota bacterium]